MYWKCAWSICVILNVVQDTASRGYALKCPEASQRSMRARLVCGKEVWYHCLYDENEMRYVETCELAKELTTGRKAVYSGNIDARVCTSGRYMPFIYISNMSADCLYQRSYCNEEGQIQMHERSSAEDTACVCDFTKGYAFVTEPKAVCYCVPSEEDCSCYKKSCQDNSYMLSPDYRCVPRTSSLTGVRCQVSLSKIPDVEADVENCHTESLKYDYTGSIKPPGKRKLVAAKLIIRLCVVWLIVTSTSLVIVMIYEIDDETIKEDDDAPKLPIKIEEMVTQQKQEDFNTVGNQSRTKEEDVFCLNCPSAERVLYLDGEKLQRGLENKPRILDVCFMNLKSGLSLIYIDADNDKIVTCTVYVGARKSKAENIKDKDMKGPNRLSKIDDRRVAIIYKKAFDIIIFNVHDMKKENSYVVNSAELEVHTVQYYIEGITSLSPNELILSNKERLFIAKFDAREEKVTLVKFAPSIHKFDTARRLTCVTVPTNDHISSAEKLFKGNIYAKVVFIADENDKTITSIGKNGDKIDELRDHNRGLQNVRGIAATEEYIFAATSAGVSVYTHKQGHIKNKYSMLIEYKKHVDHTRGLCIETKGNLIYLALTCVIKRTDVIAVFSFETSDLKNLQYE